MDKFSQSTEDYLEAIYRLEESDGKIKSTRVADLLSVSKPAVNKAMTELIDKGLITKESYGDIILTLSGRAHAKTIFAKHNAIKTLLLKIGVPENIAEDDSCKIEHAISSVTYDKLCLLIKRL